MTEHKETWRKDDNRAWVGESTPHLPFSGSKYIYYLSGTYKPAVVYSECVLLLPSQKPQEHWEAGLVFHNPTTLQWEAKH